jgi:hypothetical protein
MSCNKSVLFQMEVTSLYSSQRTGVTPASIIVACVRVMFEVFCRPVPFQDYLLGCVEDRVTLREFYLELLRFSSVNILPPILHTHSFD